MSKHWNPRDVPRQASGTALGGRDIALTLIAGLVLGLLYVLLTTNWTPAPTAEPDLSTIEAPDYYAESRKSAEILREQEGAPPSARGALSTYRGAEKVGAGAAVVVIDGDTFRYGGQKIRIADIDTPEVRGRCAYESELAGRATRRLGQLLAAGPFELQSIGRDEDQYGRKLRVVTRGGQSLGDILVAEGLARTWTGRREPWC